MSCKMKLRELTIGKRQKAKLEIIIFKLVRKIKLDAEEAKIIEEIIEDK